MLFYLIDIVIVGVDDEVLDGLHIGFNGGLLGRFRFKEVGNLLNSWLKNNLKVIFEGNLGVLVVLDLEGVDDMVAVPVLVGYGIFDRVNQ